MWRKSFIWMMEMPPRALSKKLIVLHLNFPSNTDSKCLWMIFFICFFFHLSNHNLLNVNSRSDVGNMVAWCVPLDLSFWNYNKSNSCNPTRNTQPNIQTCLKDLRISASLGGRIQQARVEEREWSRDRCFPCSPEPLMGLGEGRH